MKIFFVLKVLSKFSFLFRMLGIDGAAVLSILRVKLIMDGRRVPTIMAASEQKEGNYFVKSLPIYLVVGLFLLLMFFLPTPVFFKMNLVYAMSIFMVISTLVSEFSSLLLDVADKEILLPRPIDNKTVNVAKILHILIYLLAIILTMSTPLLIVGVIRHGLLFFVIFIVQMFFVAGFSIFITSLLYFLILRFLDSERLKDFINYLQIGFSIAMFIGFQLMGGAFSIVGLDLTTIFIPWWSYLLPTAWFSAPYALFIDYHFKPQFIWLSVIGVVMSVLFVIMYVKMIAPYFEKNLSKLMDNSGRKKINAGKLFSKWAQLICVSKFEKCFYTFSKRLMTSERYFKLRLYPNLALAALFPIIMLFNNLRFEKSLMIAIISMQGGNHFLYLYFSLVLFCSSLPLMASSESYDAAWIYRVMPIGSTAYVYSGALKAYITHAILPTYLVTSIFFVLLIGVSAMPHLLVIFLNIIFIIVFLFNMITRKLPFSQKYTYIKSTQLSILLVSLMFTLFFWGVHYFSLRFSYGILIYLLLMTTINKLYWRKSFKPAAVRDMNKLGLW